MRKVIIVWIGGVASNRKLGTSIAFTGAAPPAPAPDFTVTIDDVDSQAQFNSSVAGNYGLWYESPELSDGEHTVTVSKLEGAELDYALVTAGNTGLLDDADVVVDDLDPSITYFGTWAQETTLHSNTTAPLPVQPFGNGVQDTRAAGSSCQFRFSGELQICC